MGAQVHTHKRICTHTHAYLYAPILTCSGARTHTPYRIWLFFYCKQAVFLIKDYIECPISDQHYIII